VKKLTLVIGMALVVAMPAVANVIWSDGFSNATGWSIVYDQDSSGVLHVGWKSGLHVRRGGELAGGIRGQHADPFQSRQQE